MPNIVQRSIVYTEGGDWGAIHPPHECYPRTFEGLAINRVISIIMNSKEISSSSCLFVHNVTLIGTEMSYALILAECQYYYELSYVI